MRTAALVPVKGLGHGKTRLGSALARAASERLALAMLDDVLAALGETRGLEWIAVTTPDPRVAARARAAGAQVIDESPGGLNPAIDGASRALTTAGADAVLVLLADVAGAFGEDLTRVVEAGAANPTPAAVLAPSQDGGTSALLRAPHDCFASAFGRHSADAHRAQARQCGVPLTELCLPSLALDLDRPLDLATFVAGDGAGPRTRALLAELGVQP